MDPPPEDEINRHEFVIITFQGVGALKFWSRGTKIPINLNIKSLRVFLVIPENIKLALECSRLQ